MKNQIMLITYADSFGKNLKELNNLLDCYFKREIGSIHILPFFPSSGDRGFAPLTYEEVDPTFGDWDDVRKLSDNYELMFDFMINHLSRQSPQFLDFIEKHEDSLYKDMFIRFNKFWPNGFPTEKEIAKLNKRKNHAPFEKIQFTDGTSEDIWCTFSEEQMDLNLDHQITWDFVEKSLEFLMNHGASMMRLDAFAFATKKLGTSCFFVEPEMWELMARVKKILDRKQIPMLPEIHDHFTIQQQIADKGYPVYDFALPMIVLHTLYTGNNRALKHWFEICPKNSYTTLDTHDGIGVIDSYDLLSMDEIQYVLDKTESNGANFKMDFSEKALDKPVVYQINCTYFSALGEDADAYLLARAIQFFGPGVPQVYYVGLLAGKNDYELMKSTNFPRNISRHNYTVEEVDEQVNKPVVQKLKKLMRLRNDFLAFDGPISIVESPDHILEIIRESNGCKATLRANLKTFCFEIACSDSAFNFSNGSDEINDCFFS